MRTNVVLGNCEKSLVNSGSGGSKGDARDARPLGSKFFQFHAVFGEIWQIVNWRPPPPESWHRHLGEILDSPLSDANEISIQWVSMGFHFQLF